MHRNAVQLFGSDGAAEQREDEGDDDPEHSAILEIRENGHDSRRRLAWGRPIPTRGRDFFGAGDEIAARIAKEMLDILNAAM
jgi:hypothetical protein